MLELKDFIHLPQLDELAARIVADKQGLIVVAGVDSHPLGSESAGLTPSGRATIARILLRQILTADPQARAAVVIDGRDTIRLPRHLKRQVKTWTVSTAHPYGQQIELALQQRPDLLVIDRLDGDTAPLALTAVQQGIRVLAQCDTVFRGGALLRHLLNLKIPPKLLPALRWVVTVQRLPMLCAHCKEPALFEPGRLADLAQRYPTLVVDKPFYQATGCGKCRYNGRQGEVTAFDIFHAPADADLAHRLNQPSLLTLEEYMLGLAMLGYVPLEDVAQLDADHFQQAYDLLATGEQMLAATNATLQRKIAELETANRLLQQRTEVLASLYDIGLALTTLTDLMELADRICRHVHELAGARRAILYFLYPDYTAEVLAQRGWDPGLVGRHIEADLLLNSTALLDSAKPIPFTERPPGITEPISDNDLPILPTGLRVLLLAQNELVGFMIVHTGPPSSHKLGFTPGEVTLLQTFANQAALAIQRTGLIQTLREKVNQLEAAQIELVQKERQDRELELARQVQQSLLPRTFPAMPGYAFAARSQPARLVGGDFYDIFQLDDGRFGLVIADVSDKGMPAALFMALTRSLLLAEARREASPRAVLANVNRLLLELSEPKMFVTVFYGVVDAAARRMTYARAGHDWPLLLRQGSAQRLQGSGTFVGFLDDDFFYLSEEEVDLRPGDRLVLYTDGLCDLMGPEGQSLGMDSILSCLQRCAHLTADGICTAVFDDLTTFQGDAEQYDDMTLLLVEVKEI